MRESAAVDKPAKHSAYDAVVVGLFIYACHAFLFIATTGTLWLLGRDLDYLHALLAPGNQGEQYFLGVLRLQLILFVLSLIVLTLFAWRRFRSARLVGIVFSIALLQGLFCWALESYTAGKTGPRALISPEEEQALFAAMLQVMSARVEPTASPADAEGLEQPPGNATITLSLDVRHPGLYRFLVGIAVDQHKPPKRFSFERTISLKPGRQEFRLPVPASELEKQRKAPWLWTEEQESRLGTRVLLVTSVQDLAAILGRDPQREEIDMRSMGVGEKDLASLFPKRNDVIAKEIGEWSFTLDMAPVPRD